MCWFWESACAIYSAKRTSHDLAFKIGSYHDNIPPFQCKLFYISNQLLAKYIDCDVYLIILLLQVEGNQLCLKEFACQISTSCGL